MNFYSVLFEPVLIMKSRLSEIFILVQPESSRDKDGTTAFAMLRFRILFLLVLVLFVLLKLTVNSQIVLAINQKFENNATKESKNLEPPNRASSANTQRIPRPPIAPFGSSNPVNAADRQNSEPLQSIVQSHSQNQDSQVHAPHLPPNWHWIELCKKFAK